MLAMCWGAFHEIQHIDEILILVLYYEFKRCVTYVGHYKMRDITKG